MSEEKGVTESKVIWDCEIPTIEEGKSWTVGDIHTLSCNGEYIEKLEGKISVEVSLPPPQNAASQGTSEDKKEQVPEEVKSEYALKIIETKQVDNTSADFLITSYQPGQYKDLKVKLIDEAKNEVSINPMSWEVVTVITKENQNGFGPTQPISLTFPWWYWGSIWAALALFALIIIGRVLLFNKKKRQQKAILAHATALGSVNQFYKDLRHLKNTHSSSGVMLDGEALSKYWLELTQLFNLYLIREFLVPANKWNMSKLVNAVRKKLGPLSSLRLNNQLKRILNEFHKGSKVETITVEDIEQMEALCQSYVEAIKKLDRKVN